LNLRIKPHLAQFLKAQPKAGNMVDDAGLTNETNFVEERTLNSH
jgi:hypothetical protein